MLQTDRQILEHIEKYCLQVENAIERFGNDFSTFCSDEFYQAGISMCILQIGELAKNLSDDFRKSTEEISHWRKIAGTRDRYAHGYLSLNLATVWETAVKDVPALKEQCGRYLSGIERETKLPQTEKISIRQELENIKANLKSEKESDAPSSSPLQDTPER